MTGATPPHGDPLTPGTGGQTAGDSAPEATPPHGDPLGEQAGIRGRGDLASVALGAARTASQIAAGLVRRLPRR